MVIFVGSLFMALVAYLFSYLGFITFLKALMVIASILVVATVLLQPAKSGAMSPLGGSSQSVFGSTGGTTFLFQVTMLSAIFIMLSSLGIAWHRIQLSRSSVIDASTIVPVTTPANPAAAPGTPAPPAPGTPVASPGAGNAASAATPTAAATTPKASAQPAARVPAPNAAPAAPTAPAKK